MSSNLTNLEYYRLYGTLSNERIEKLLEEKDNILMLVDTIETAKHCIERILANIHNAFIPEIADELLDILVNMEEV